MNISSLTSYQYNDLRSQAQTLINAYDRDGDGRLSRYEAQQTASYGGDSYSFNTRLNSSYVQRTTIYQTTYGHLNADLVESADRNYDGTVDADDSVDMDGQIMVREQMKIFGNSEFQGRVMVEDRDSASNAYDAVSNPNGRKGSNNVDANTLNGNMTVTYNGHLGDIVTTIELPAGPSTYTNNISGWLEQ